MEKQEKNKTEQNPMPLGMILDHAREDMTKSVVALAAEIRASGKSS